MAYFRTLVEQDHAAQQARSVLRKERLETALNDMDAEPWQRTLLTGIMARYERGETNLIVSTPPQHPQQIWNGPSMIAQAEAMARKGLPILVTQAEYDALRSSGKIAPDQLYMIKGDPITGSDDAVRNFFGARR